MSRVPTDSNIADDPSRGDCESLMSMGVSKTEVNVDLVWNDVQEFQLRGGGATTSNEVPHVVKKCASGQKQEFHHAVQRIAI